MPGQPHTDYVLELAYYRSMKCPVCDKEMKKVRWDISYNTNEDNKEYDRTLYQCLADDVWVTTEIPNGKSGEKAS